MIQPPGYYYVRVNRSKTGTKRYDTRRNMRNDTLHGKAKGYKGRGFNPHSNKKTAPYNLGDWGHGPFVVTAQRYNR
ncbi:hypothetical protein ABER23_22455 [Paenibacillus lautus]|uniref:hypothetical protein n=1 Tax=Paenibacillus lautus TaxID=1401 RepID=UPI003D2B70D3